MLAPVLEVAAGESEGMNRLPSRNDLILVMRRREEADGERRMMGSGRRVFWRVASC